VSRGSVMRDVEDHQSGRDDLPILQAATIVSDSPS
jgi:hypothetical protein